jgi:hypothetical protein
LLAILTLFPALKRRLRQLAVGASIVQRAHSPVATELADLSSRARHIYTGLKATMENHSKESS